MSCDANIFERVVLYAGDIFDQFEKNFKKFWAHF